LSAGGSRHDSSHGKLAQIFTLETPVAIITVVTICLATAAVHGTLPRPPQQPHEKDDRPEASNPLASAARHPEKTQDQGERNPEKDLSQEMTADRERAEGALGVKNVPAVGAQLRAGHRVMRSGGRRACVRAGASFGAACEAQARKLPAR